MATDPQTSDTQLDPAFYEGVNFLGRPTSVSLLGQEPNPAATALAAGGAPVSAAATTPAGTGTGPTDVAGSSPRSDILTSLLEGTTGKIKQIADLFSEPPSRGDIGGPDTPQGPNQSLSDQVRSTTPPTSPAAAASGLDFTGEGGVFGGAGGGPALLEGGPAAGEGTVLAAAPAAAASGLGPGAGSVVAGSAEGAASALPAATQSLSALEGGIYGAIPQAVISLWESLNTYFKDKARAESIVQSAKAGLKDVETVLPELAAGAVDPGTIARMTPEQLQSLYTNALNAYSSSGSLAQPFSLSGKSKMGIRFPDYTEAIGAAQQLEPVDFVNMVAAYDALAKQGLTPDQPLAFPEALHALAGSAGLPEYSAGGPATYTALAPFDPYYANQPVVQGMPSENDPVGTRAARSPEEYLSTIGADPALASKLGPLMEGVAPGGYLDRARQIFTLLNPNFDQSELGALLARLGSTGTTTTGTTGDTTSSSSGGGLFDTPPAIAGGTPQELEQV